MEESHSLVIPLSILLCGLILTVAFITYDRPPVMAPLITSTLPCTLFVSLVS